MILARLLNQAVSYEAPGAPDGEGGRTYSAAVTIVARKEDKSELFIDSQGREQISNAIVYLSQSVDLQGKIDGYEIRAVNQSAGVAGRTPLYKVML